MPAFLGIDLGTSAVKAVIIDDAQGPLAELSRPLETQHPRPLWSEQDPGVWWRTVCDMLDGFRTLHGRALDSVRAIGLSGQMHGAVCLDAAGAVLRPAILWDDGRAQAEAADLSRLHPDLAAVVGVLPMAGLTAPKLLWLAQREPDVFRAIAHVLLPKDDLRRRLTGELATDMSDASGTWWLDVARRDWSDAALAASRLSRRQVPRLVEGSAVSGQLRPELAGRWGLPPGVIVAGGAGDVAGAAVGLGAVGEGDCFISLGTSAQLFATTLSHCPSPQTLVHAFAHALPQRWFRMAAMLNGASCLAFAARLFGEPPATLVREAETAAGRQSPVTFLPYLAGERTPHNDPNAKGVFFGLTPSTDRADVALAVLEGVAFSFADALAAVEQAGTRIERPAFVGGGAQSALWTRIIADVIDRPLTRYRAADLGPAFGAARLARLAMTGEDPRDVCVPPPILDVAEPDPARVAAYRPQIERFRRLYAALKPEFQHVL